MNTKFTTIQELDIALQNRLYLNRTADPTNVKYLYEDMLHQIEYFRQFVLDIKNYCILAYDRKYYHRVDLLSVFPDNAGLSFKAVPGKISLRQLLGIGYDLRDIPEY